MSMKDLPVMQAKRFGAYSCKADESLADAASQMTTRNISALVVVDDAGYLLGIITRADLVRACYHHDDWQHQPVSAFMSRQVVAVEPDAALGEVMELLIDHRIHRIVVARTEHGKQRPVAVLSAADIVYHMMQQTEAG